MRIICIPVGVLQANCYIIKKEKKALLIDPGDEKEKIELELKDVEVVGILITHNHFDHTGALSYFEKKYNVIPNTINNFFMYETIETPGHTKDSKTFYFKEEKIMFTGDFLFKGTIGRMDLPGGSEKEMQKSLEKIIKYPEDTIIYPGHGDSTTLKEEKKYFSYYF